MTNGNDTPTRDDRVRARAYAIWEAEGRPDGAAEAHWNSACAEIDGDADVSGAVVAGDGPDAAPIRMASPESRGAALKAKARPMLPTKAQRSAMANGR